MKGRGKTETRHKTFHSQTGQRNHETFLLKLSRSSSVTRSPREKLRESVLGLFFEIDEFIHPRYH